jgi:tight adherence protein B
MSITQLLLIAVGLMAFMVLGYLGVSGPSPAKEAARRLEGLRDRHSDSTTDKVEAQLRKAVAARKPKLHQIAGSESRIAALLMRLHRTGKGWTLSQYLYASGGLALAVTLIVFIKSGAAALSLGIGLMVGAGLPHAVVSFFISKRNNAFTTKFPDAIELLVRGLRSGLPVTETLGVVATEVPGPVGEEFKLVTEQDHGGCPSGHCRPAEHARVQLLLHHPGNPARDRG